MHHEMLNDERVILRAWQPADLRALAALRNDAALQAQLMTEPRPANEARVARWLADKSDQPDTAFFIVADRSSDAPAGYLQYVGVRSRERIAELGICVAAAFRGTGHAAAAIALAEAHVAATFGVRKFVLRVFSDNARARAFFERAGYARCGEWRAHAWRDGHWRDVTLMERFAGSAAAESPGGPGGREARCGGSDRGGRTGKAGGADARSDT